MMVHMIISNILETITFIKIVFNVFEEVIDILGAYFKMQSVHFHMMSLVEICLIKLWLNFGRKRMITMDETFIVWSLTAINVMISFLLSTSKMMVGDLFGFSSESSVEKR